MVRGPPLKQGHPESCTCRRPKRESGANTEQMQRVDVHNSTNAISVNFTLMNSTFQDRKEIDDTSNEEGAAPASSPQAGWYVLHASDMSRSPGYTTPVQDAHTQPSLEQNFLKPIFARRSSLRYEQKNYPQGQEVITGFTGNTRLKQYAPQLRKLLYTNRWIAACKIQYFNTVNWQSSQ